MIKTTCTSFNYILTFEISRVDAVYLYGLKQYDVFQVIRPSIEIDHIVVVSFGWGWGGGGLHIFFSNLKSKRRIFMDKK